MVLIKLWGKRQLNMALYTVDKMFDIYWCL